MGSFSAPEISRRSQIYRMARDRNNKVLITSLAVFVFGVLSLYDGIVRPGAQTPVVMAINFAIIGISFYGFFLFLTRSQDVFRHPDVKKFLSFENPQHFIDLFEQEYKEEGLKMFRNGFVTPNFVVAQSFYRFRWAHSKEITMAYLERSRLSLHRIPLPFFGTGTVLIHLKNGTVLHINCNSKEDAETLLMMLTKMTPDARYGSIVSEKTDVPEDIDAIMRDVTATIRQMPDLQPVESPAGQSKGLYGAYARDSKISTLAAGLKGNAGDQWKPHGSPRSVPGTVVKPESASVRPKSKEEIINGHTKDLYNSLDKGDIARSVAIMDAMGDMQSPGAADILEILLEYDDESVRAHAAFALGKLGQKSSVGPLIKALDDQSVLVRENAADALGKIGDLRAVAPLQQVSTRDVRVKKAAVSALARIDQKLGIYNQPGGDWSRPFFVGPSDD